MLILCQQRRTRHHIDIVRLKSGEELDSGAIKDKASKINYLDKIVALVGLCSGHDIDVRPSKVVAGLEPEGTNALLTVRRWWGAGRGNAGGQRLLTMVVTIGGRVRPRLCVSSGFGQ